MCYKTVVVQGFMLYLPRKMIWGCKGNQILSKRLAFFCKATGPKLKAFLFLIVYIRFENHPAIDSG